MHPEPPPIDLQDYSNFTNEFLLALYNESKVLFTELRIKMTNRYNKEIKAANDIHDPNDAKNSLKTFKESLRMMSKSNFSLLVSQSLAIPIGEVAKKCIDELTKRGIDVNSLNDDSKIKTQNIKVSGIVDEEKPE